MSNTLPLLESLLNEFPGLAYRCLNDKYWTMQYVSSGIQALTGYTADIFTGSSPHTYSDIIHVDDRARVEQEIAHALDAGTGFALDYRIVTANGTVKHVNEHGNAIRDEHGNVLALQGFVTDVSTAWQMRHVLHEVKERFRWIAQATNDNIWHWNLQTNEIWHGNNGRQVFALPSDEIRTDIDCWSELLHPEDKGWVLASLNAAIAGMDNEWSIEYRLQRIDGSYAAVLGRAFIIRDAGKKAVRMMGGISDLTERRQSKLHLERLKRVLDLLNQCNQCLLRAADERELLTDLCQLIVHTGGYRDASVSLAGTNVAPFPCHAARAMHDNRQIVCSNIALDPALVLEREALLGRGYRSGIWLPLTQDSRKLGVLGIYSAVLAPFEPEEVQLLQTIADNVAFGIANLRSREDRKRIELAAIKIAAGVSGTGEAFFTQLARNMALAVGADGAFVARFDGKGLQSAQTVSAVLDDEIIANFSYVLAGSPCEQLITSSSSVVLNDVSVCFPNSTASEMNMHGYAGCRLDSAAGCPLGLLFVLFRGQVVRPQFAIQAIQIFAARAAAELERQISHARILEQASLLDKAKDAIVVHDASNRITFWNKGAERLYGLSADEVMGTPVNKTVYDDVDRFEAIRSILDEHNEWQGEITRLHRDGAELVLEVNSTLMRDTSGQPSAVLSIITDITRRKLAEREVAALAFRDRLTGLPNRHSFEKQLQEFLDRDSIAGHTGALLWIDLDRLKSLNDTRGHAAGDLLLQQTSERIKQVIGRNGTVARFGGDEFVVLIPQLDKEGANAIAIAKALLQKLNEPFHFDRYTHSGSASIGLAYFCCGQDAATEILKRADIAMYEAKAAGRNILRLFDTQMQQAVDLRAELENDMRLALHRDALYLVYQPQVSDAGQVVGVEALLRWKHPRHGLISPAQFISIAETSGLIIAIGGWVLDQACAQLRRWEADAATRMLSIAVNVSARQVHHPGFVAQVMGILRRSGANPYMLKLELTESSLVTDTEATVEKMKTLKAIGISFSLDDFGTGFSSLAYLKRLPLDQLKIDRTFVSDVVKDANAAVITRSVIALGQSLSLEVIAEGVETECQHRFLAAHGCSIYQGYLFSRPLAIDALETYCRQTFQRLHSHPPLHLKLG